MSAPSHAAIPMAILVTCGFDMLRDVGHAYAQKLASAGNEITYVPYPELPHGFIQMTAHSRHSLEATQELVGLLGEALRKSRRPAAGSHTSGRRRYEPAAD
jgi:acetyl esterase